MFCRRLLDGVTAGYFAAHAYNQRKTTSTQSSCLHVVVALWKPGKGHRYQFTWRCLVKTSSHNSKRSLTSKAVKTLNLFLPRKLSAWTATARMPWKCRHSAVWIIKHPKMHLLPLICYVVYQKTLITANHVVSKLWITAWCADWKSQAHFCDSREASERKHTAIILKRWLFAVTLRFPIEAGSFMVAANIQHRVLRGTALCFSSSFETQVFSQTAQTVSTTFTPFTPVKKKEHARRTLETQQCDLRLPLQQPLYRASFCVQGQFLGYHVWLLPFYFAFWPSFYTILKAYIAT